MKKLLLKILLFLLLFIISVYIFFSQVDGYTDPYYKKFTTLEQSSLILGISKAAQGLQPQIFNKLLNRNDLFNYSFTISSSPYGPLYLESIKRKLNQETKDGIFILTVDAWTLCSNTDDPNDSLNFSELNMFLNNDFVNLDPNIPYLLKYYDKKYVNILRESHSSFFLHNDGWLEVNIEMDSIAIEKRIERNRVFYTENYLPKWNYSSVRYSYLSKTIQYLKKYGEVFLVRMPIHEKILTLEIELVPDLDQKINALCKLHDVSYQNFTDSLSNYKYTDGLHLYKESGAKISKEIALFIAQQILD